MRIYPALLASTALVLFLIGLGPERPYVTPSSFVNTYFPAELSLRKVVANLSFFDHDLNDVTWTLRMEMIGSCLLPFLWFASRWISRVWVFLLVPCVVAIFFCPAVISIAVLPAFLMGFGGTYSWGFWRSARHPVLYANIFIVLGILLLLIAKPLVVWMELPFSFSYLSESFGAWLLISSLAYGPDTFVGRTLDSPTARWIGRISFSYYLLQPIFLVALSSTFLDPLLSATRGWFLILPGVILWMGSSMLAFPAAELFYRRLEKPCISISKKLILLWTSNSKSISATSSPLN